MSRICISTVSFFLAIILQNSVSAADPDVGAVSNFKGSALISRASVGGLTVQNNIGVKMDDVIETGKGSLSVLFKDETLVDISQHSMLLIDDFVYDPTASTGALAIKATLGTLRYVSGEIAKNSADNVNISTPTASVAVRGTEFTATVDEIGRSTFVLLPSCDFTGLNCVVGAIEVSTDAGTVFMNQANQMTQVDSASLAPTLPVILDQSYTQIGANFILGGPSVSRKVAGIKQAEANEASEGANIFIDQLDVDLLDNESLLDEGGLASFDLLGDELKESFLVDPLAELTELASAVTGSAESSSDNSAAGSGSPTVTEGPVGVSLDQETEAAVISINFDPTSTQTVTISNDSESTGSIDVGGGGGAAISIIQSQ